MSAPRSAQVSDFEGAAATAIRRARRGEETVIISNGEEVARVVPPMDNRIRLEGGGTIRPGQVGARIGLGADKIRLRGEPLSETILRNRG